MPNVRVELIALLLRPLTRFCLRHSVKLQELVELCKISFLEVAIQEVGEANASVNMLSMMSGVHRRDIVRILKHRAPPKKEGSIISRIVGQWQQAKPFCTSGGRPRVLTWESGAGSFGDLVHSVSREVSPYSVLAELERLGMVVRRASSVKLTSKVFLSKGNLSQGFRFLQEDMDDLICAVEENLMAEEAPNLHLKTEYDNIAEESIPAIREWLLSEGSSFHERARKFIASFDRDVTRQESEPGRRMRVALGAFSRINKVPAQVNAGD